MYIINKIKSNVMLVCPNTIQKEREERERKGEKKQETRRR